MENHGTPSPGQVCTVASNIIRALPRAFELASEAGIDTKAVIKWTGQVNQAGERLSLALAEAFRMLYNGHVATIPHFSFAHDRRKDGWTLLEDVGFNPELTSAASLEPAPFLEKGEKYVNGEVMAVRAKTQGANFGQKHVEYLLEHQKDIPEEFEKFYLVFPGTKWRDPRDRRRVPVLYWHCDEWILDWSGLGCDGWDGNSRLVHPLG